MRAPTRWPLRPPPGPHESMSSWLERVAGLYQVMPADLLSSAAGLHVTVTESVDVGLPEPVLTALAERTGLDEQRLQTMTLPGWAPWLFDTYPIASEDADAVFGNYVRADSVLWLPRAAKLPTLTRHAWRGPWLPLQPLHRVCPVCIAETRQRGLLWDLPLTVGCIEHRCRLLFSADAIIGAEGKEPEPIPISEPLVVLEDYTRQALTSGVVEVPGRTVHAGVWFRLLRSLLDELSVAMAALSSHGKRTAEQIWSAAELPVRAGISMWRPYENLPWEMQEKLLTGAATAIALAGSRRIVAWGTLGSLLAATPHERVYEGDDPRLAADVAVDPVAPFDFAAAAEEALRAARARPEAGAQMFRILTWYNTTPEDVVRQREYLIRQGIPAEFLYLNPQPLWGRSVTPAEAAVILVREGHDPAEARQAVGDFLTEIRPELTRYGKKAGTDAGQLTEDDLGQLRARLSL